MKVAFLLDDSLDTTDGVQQYVLTLGNWLQSKGHKIYYLVGQTVRKDIKNIHSLSKNYKVKFNKNILTIPGGIDKKFVSKLLNDEMFDVIHVQMPYSPQLAGKVINLAPQTTKVVSTFHIFPASKRVSYGAKILKLITKKSLNRIDSFISVSEPAKKFMKSTYGINSTVIPNMINLANVNKGLVTNKNKYGIKKIVFLGRLVERKGAEYLIKAFSKINNEKVELIIGGKGPDEAKLKLLCKNLEITEKVTFAGFISERDKFNFLNQADIAVFPSTGGESFGIILLEAIAAGAKVVIGGDNDGYVSTLKNNKQVLIDPMNTESFSEKLETLLKDEAQIKEINRWQNKLISSYDIEIVGPKILEIYNNKNM